MSSTIRTRSTRPIRSLNTSCARWPQPGVPLATREVQLVPRKEDVAVLRRIVGASGPVLLVHPGSRSPWRIWPAERFAAVCDRAQDELGAQVVLAGGPGERTLIAADPPHRAHPYPRLHGAPHAAAVRRPRPHRLRGAVPRQRPHACGGGGRDAGRRPVRFAERPGLSPVGDGPYPPSAAAALHRLRRPGRMRAGRLLSQLLRPEAHG